MERSQVQAAAAVQPAFYLGGVLTLQKDGYTVHRKELSPTIRKIAIEKCPGIFQPSFRGEKFDERYFRDAHMLQPVLTKLCEISYTPNFSHNNVILYLQAFLGLHYRSQMGPPLYHCLGQTFCCVQDFSLTSLISLMLGGRNFCFLCIKYRCQD